MRLLLGVGVVDLCEVLFCSKDLLNGKPARGFFEVTLSFSRFHGAD